MLPIGLLSRTPRYAYRLAYPIGQTRLEHRYATERYVEEDLRRTSSAKTSKWFRLTSDYDTRLLDYRQYITLYY